MILRVSLYLKTLLRQPSMVQRHRMVLSLWRPNVDNMVLRRLLTLAISVCRKQLLWWKGWTRRMLPTTIIRLWNAVVRLHDSARTPSRSSVMVRIRTTIRILTGMTSPLRRLGKTAITWVLRVVMSMWSTWLQLVISSKVVSCPMQDVSSSMLEPTLTWCSQSVLRLIWTSLTSRITIVMQVVHTQVEVVIRSFVNSISSLLGFLIRMRMVATERYRMVIQLLGWSREWRWNVTTETSREY